MHEASSGAWECCASEASAAGAEVILGEWESEAAQRSFAIEQALKRGFTHALILGPDEFIEPELLETLEKIAKSGIADSVSMSGENYWKSSHYIVRPGETSASAMLIDLRRANGDLDSNFGVDRPLKLGPEFGLVHRLSFAGPDERILRKLEAGDYGQGISEDWFRRVWLKWDNEPLLTNLHPSHSQTFEFAERIDTPEILKGVWDERPLAGGLEKPRRWPSISVIIPLFGGEDDIRLCLDGLKRCEDLLHEIIVVDDASSDAAAQVAESYSGVKVLRNQENLGFGASCNRGLHLATGEVVVFLHSDTLLPRDGLIRLIETLVSSGVVGAAGPLTNNAGNPQLLSPTYRNLANLDNFAHDMAGRDVDDIESSFLSSFCLAVRRSVLDEVGPFDESFGKGFFEDHDLCYRIQRAGFKLKVSNRSYVHHEGAKSLCRAAEIPEVLLAMNAQRMHEKWKGELESGFASHLPGQRLEPIVFRSELHPDALRERCLNLAREADISLCMIVRDEERVIRDCLESARHCFTQIVVVDTGSKDKTVEIARELGAEVHQIVWPEHFAKARNESLKHARGRWIFWLDADDTLPLLSCEAILRAAIEAPPNIAGFLIPVQFVEEGPGAGMRVDHVKLFRNFPDVVFEGRIHEQVWDSVRAHGEIGRVPGAVVMHSGYDMSIEGQQKKAVRDSTLLEKDLEDRPNHPFVLFNFGMTNHMRGDHKAAVHWLERCLSVANPGDSYVRKAYALLGTSTRELGDSQKALQIYEKGIEVVKGDPELEFLCAWTLMQMQRYAESKARFLSMGTDASKFISAFDVGIIGFKRFGNLGRVCLSMGDYVEAKEYLLKALEMNPRAYDCAIELIRAALDRDDFRTAQAALDQFRASAGPTEAWADLQAKVVESRGGSPEEFLQEATQQFPTAAGPRLVLVRRMMNSTNAQEAVEHLEILEDLGVAEAAFYQGVLARQRGDLNEALVHMTRANELHPGHEATIKHLEALQNEASVGGATQEQALVVGS